jgi:lipopolysaccharide export system ATP-binding protein
VTSVGALSAEGVTVRLGGRTVLHDVSIRVAPGEVLGIFGPSGAGKSTLFRALAGEERLIRGRITLHGSDVTERPLWERARRGLGYVPQTPSVLWDLTVDENMAVFAAVVRRARKDPRQPVAGGATEAPRALDAVAELGLSQRGNVLARALSGGERRRLELARAVSARPTVLLCDEPFAALDPHGMETVANRLRTLADEGTAVVIADHNVAAALRVCDRAALLLAGELAALATPDEFRQHERVRTHYVVVEGSDQQGALIPSDRPERPA